MSEEYYIINERQLKSLIKRIENGKKEFNDKSKTKIEGKYEIEFWNDTIWVNFDNGHFRFEKQNLEGGNDEDIDAMTSNKYCIDCVLKDEEIEFLKKQLQKYVDINDLVPDEEMKGGNDE